MFNLGGPFGLLRGEELVGGSQSVPLRLRQRVLRGLSLGLRVREVDAYALIRARLHGVDGDLTLLEPREAFPRLMNLVGGEDRLSPRLFALRRDLLRRLRAQRFHLLDLLEIVRDSRLLFVRVPHLHERLSLRLSSLLQELSLQPPGVLRRFVFHLAHLDGVVALKLRELLLRRPGPFVHVGDRLTRPGHGGVGGGVLRVFAFPGSFPRVPFNLGHAIIRVALGFPDALVVVLLRACNAVVRGFDLRRLRRVFRADRRELGGERHEFVFVLANRIFQSGSFALSRDHRRLRRLELRRESIAQVLLDRQLLLARFEGVGEPREALLFSR